MPTFLFDYLKSSLALTRRFDSPTISDVVADAGSYAYGTSHCEKSKLIRTPVHL